MKLSNIGCRFRETKKFHIEIPVEILEFVSCETPLQGDYTERVNKLLKKYFLQFIFFIKNIKIVVITNNKIVIIAIIC